MTKKNPPLPPGETPKERLAKQDQERLSYWRGLTKQAWIAAARADLPSFRRGGYTLAEPCEICRMTAELSEYHHVLPLEEQFDRGFVTPAHYPSAWLCPNHHAIIHKLMGFDDFRTAASHLARLYGLTDAQAENISKLIEKSREPHHRDRSR